jgi:alpha-galactosidase
MSVHFDKQRNLWVLQTLNSGYVFGLHTGGHLKHTWWGERLHVLEDYPDLNTYRDRVWWDWNDELPVRGEGNMAEICLKACFFDGTRDIILDFDGQETPSEQKLVLSFVDPFYKLRVLLNYQVWEKYDVIERWTVLKNESENPILLEEMGSASWYLPPLKNYTLTHLSGMWAHETRKLEQPVSEGKIIIESRLGQTSAFHNPFFALSNDASEDYGRIWFGTLAWSGNWKITVNRQLYENTQICGGINGWDTQYLLEPGETFTTPIFTGGFTSGGFGQMSRLLHRYQLEKVLPKRSGETIAPLRKILYNSWEATNFQVNEENQKRLADLASKIGVEVFVMDDGWFGNRDTDRAGLGDWTVNPRKFPNGLKPLIDHVNTLGMDFGLWVEPEMVNPDSNLYRKHPEWVLQFPNRPKTLRRNQFILNVANEEVKRFIFTTVDRLVTESNISFIKWDMNRPILESGWAGAPDGREREVWIRYVHNLYEIWDILQKKHPEVTFESCAGGGGRVDFGILERADQVWVSDNTDPFDRQYIQEGFSMVYAPKIMMNWVTDWGGKHAYPLSFRFHTAMMGAMGVGADLTRYTEEELQEAKDFIGFYKGIREVIQNGELYRLRRPSEDGWTVNQYLDSSKKTIVVIALKNPNPLSMFEIPSVRLKGLLPNDKYRLNSTETVFSGSFLGNVGVPILFEKRFNISLLEPTHFQSQVFVFNKV